MTDTQTVEGFANYATFGVAVVIDSDKEMSDDVRAAVDALITNTAATKVWTREQAIRFTVADELKDRAENYCEEGEPSLLAVQMIQAGLAEVDWDDLADHYLRAVREQDDDDDPRDPLQGRDPDELHDKNR